MRLSLIRRIQNTLAFGDDHADWPERITGENYSPRALQQHSL
jgi:hypothetical protein